MKFSSRAARPSLIVSLLFAAASCSVINAPDEVRPAEGAGGTGGMGVSVSAVSASSSSSSGTGGMVSCTPGAEEPCYEGPAGTENVGICKGGTHVCDSTGKAWGACEGQAVPAAQEDCNTFLDDEDCDGKPKNGCPTRLLIVSAGGDSETPNVRDHQLATGSYALVDTFDAMNGTPSLATLMSYDAALVFSDNPFQDPFVLGNVLADYFDAGGRVVVAAFAVTTVSGLAGRFMDPAQGYALIAQGPVEAPMDQLGAILEPGSPLVQGVQMLTTTGAYRSKGQEINGGIVVMRWGSGAPLIVRGTVQGRNRVDLNFFPPSFYWTGNGPEIVRNAVLFE